MAAKAWDDKRLDALVKTSFAAGMARRQQAINPAAAAEQSAPAGIGIPPGLAQKVAIVAKRRRRNDSR